jgi:cytochrome c oxidase cbb3-type subunit I/II
MTLRKIVACAAAAAALTAAAPAQEAPPGDARLARAGGEFGLGKRVYERYCVGCHGPKGDGNGEAARFLDPKPRDFTSGTFKFASVASGKLPRDEDLLKTITRGLRGTAMPSFRFVPEEERLAVIRYLKTFAPERWEGNQPGALVPRSVNPYDPTLDDPKPMAEAIERGRAAYHLRGCSGCHPSYLPAAEFEKLTGRPPRPNADRPVLTEDAWGGFIAPPDFARRALKASWTVEEIYTTVTAGIGGAAMPSMTAVPEQERWEIAYFIQSLAERRGKIAGPPPRPVGK